MRLTFARDFEADRADSAYFESFPSRPAVFALFPAPRTGQPSLPYLGRTHDLRRRLARLLSSPRRTSRILNLREIVARVEYTPVGSAFEGLWLLYLLNQRYFPGQYQKRLRLRPPALLKLKLQNRFPRCYPTRKIIDDQSLYFGPFQSQLAAEHFAGEFLDFFKIRRCVEELTPDPTHPGCIYSQMRMCLAPCFAGCTDAEYAAEVRNVVDFLNSGGQSLLRNLKTDREQAAESLEFEQAAKTHERIDKLNELLRRKGGLARSINILQGLIVLPGADPNSVAFFRVEAGRISGPSSLSLDENVPRPTPLDRQLHEIWEGLRVDGAGEAPDAANGSNSASPAWEHLSLLARWYYSSFREGEFVMLDSGQTLPHARVIRLCRKLLAPNSPE